MDGFIPPFFMKVGMTSQVFSVDALRGFRPRLIAAARKPAFPPSSYALNCLSFTLYPPAHRYPHGCNSCSSPRSDESGLSKNSNQARQTAPLIRLVCHVSISIQMTHFPASTAQSTMHPLPSLMRIPNMTGRSRLPWIFIRARRVCPYRYLMKTCIN